jgi:hypothetical protein
MDRRLRAAVDASRQWYDDVFALHGLPVRVDRGLWWGPRGAPPWHSVAKSLEPGVGSDRVARVVAGLEHCSVADSFGDLDLARLGFETLIAAQWLHRGPMAAPPERLPEGWSVVDTVDGLEGWARGHDYVGVLPPAVLDHPRFLVLALHDAGHLVGGAVTHDGGGSVGLSNAWGAGSVTVSSDVLDAVAVLHPGRSVTDYAEGTELEAMVAAGFAPLGPQRVWIR